jgi:hypothetical protein
VSRGEPITDDARQEIDWSRSLPTRREGLRMRNEADAPPCDGCDRILMNPDARRWSDRQRRFLDAYQLRPTVARAARLAGMHRATVYRWQADAAFVAAMRAAADVFYEENLARVMAEEAV